ncbi:MAG: hypothetical protein K6C05_10545 [Anaerovibrio sp.]|uniref:CdaR family protein n=1 Tax=Anaerovibrio sp. TaxID=1872532 RepID=UPI0025CCEA0E|nr:CdaR family protein [Anaerovibrio sp.]MCR5177268.1 hypothetical protein [Anaerovibrio sp.]
MINSLKNLFRKNLPAKILALIAAIVLWGFVMNEQNPPVNTTFTIPVYTINEPDNYKVELGLNEITVRVKAPRSSFTSVSSNDFKAFVDLEDASEGTNTIKVRVVVPQGFEIIDISDQTIEVKMEEIIEKSIAVDIQVSGNTGPRSALEKIIPDKDHVVVSGPKSNLSKVARVVGYVSLGNNTVDFKSNVKLIPLDGNGDRVDEVTVVPNEIGVMAKIMTDVDKKVVPIKAVYNGSPGDGYVIDSVTVQPEHMEITGKAAQLGGISEINTETFSIDAANNSDITRDVTLVLPDGILAPVKKASVKVIIKKGDSKKGATP